MFDHLFKAAARNVSAARRRDARGQVHCPIEALEPRTMLSESASAQLSLVSTSGTPTAPVYHYDITVTDTGTTNIGTFWFAWAPGEDFLPSVPSSVANPTGWSNTITGSGNQTDGSAIEWVASSHAITPGASLSGFDFVTSDSPSALAGDSPDYPGTPALTTFVYSGAAFSDAGFSFVVSPAIASGTAASTTTLASSAATAAAGTPVTFTAAVAPSSGSGATPTGTVTFLANGNSVGSAAVGSDGNATLQTSALAAGSDTITAQYSGDGTYASSTSTGIGETITPGATITPAIAKSTFPAAIVAGVASRGVVTLDITNATGAAIKGKDTLAVYASTTGSIDSSSVLLARTVKNLNVKPGKPTAVNVNVKGALPAGSYLLFARVTDPSADVIDSTAGPAVTVAAPFIALSETTIKNTIPATATAGAKSRGAVTLSVANAGNITTPGATTFALFATTDGTVDGTATKIAGIAKPLRIRSGKSARMTIPLKLIPSLPAGTYAIVVQVTDADGQITSAPAGSITISG